jgi:hypothetical protein
MGHCRFPIIQIVAMVQTNFLSSVAESWRARGAFMQPVTRYAKSGDIQVAYQLFGEGPVNLVIAPFFVSNVEVFGRTPMLLAGCFVWQVSRG